MSYSEIADFLSISDKTVKKQISSPQTKDVDRSYELAGIGGGARFFYYDADSSKNILYLQDKNRTENEDESGLETKKNDSETAAKTDSITRQDQEILRPEKAQKGLLQ